MRRLGGGEVRRWICEEARKQEHEKLGKGGVLLKDQYSHKIRRGPPPMGAQGHPLTLCSNEAAAASSRFPLLGLRDNTIVFLVQFITQAPSCSFFCDQSRSNHCVISCVINHTGKETTY